MIRELGFAPMIIALANRLSKRLFDRPPQNLDSLNQGAVIEADNLRPLFKTMGFPVEGDSNIRGFISRLLKPCYPTIVILGISLVIVNAVDLKALAVSLMHIGNKNINIMPFVANSYATMTIIFVSLVLWGIASLHHGLPYLIKWSLPETMLRNPFPLQTSATSGWLARGFVRKSQIADPDRTGVSAIAKANSVSFGTLRSVWFSNANHDESAISFFNFNHYGTPCFPISIAGITAGCKG